VELLRFAQTYLDASSTNVDPLSIQRKGEMSIEAGGVIEGLTEYLEGASDKQAKVDDPVENLGFPGEVVVFRSCLSGLSRVGELGGQEELR